MKYKLYAKVASYDGKSTWVEAWEYETDAPASLEELENYAENIILSWNSTSEEKNKRTLLDIESIGLYPESELYVESGLPVVGVLDTPDEVKIQQDLASIAELREFLIDEDTNESRIADMAIDWLINPDSEIGLKDLKLAVRYGAETGDY